VIVAVEPGELDALQRIYLRGQANGVRCELVGPQRLRELEPYAAGVGAIHVPEAGIVDYRTVCRRLAERIAERQGTVVLGAKVTRIDVSDQEVTVCTTVGEFTGEHAVNCAGLHTDRVTRMAGTAPAARIVPFRGEYFDIRPESQHLCRNLIYPVPDPSFPFLGVHFTRTIGGGLECGPNAVLAMAREGYRKSDVNFRDLAESLTYGGFLRLAARYWRTGAAEMWRSLSKAAFVRALQRLVPQIRAEDLSPAPAGVRAQAVSRDGRLVDDFLIQQSGRMIHVANAPSPAATASLNIGRLIVEQLAALE
jgi:L-2-hydroxyglutarate oxidase